MPDVPEAGEGRPEPPAALLARLRAHCNGHGSCRRCAPERGVYCSIGAPLEEALWSVRRGEVLLARRRAA